MMLAVVHHMLVTERIPLEDLLDLVAEIIKGICADRVRGVPTIRCSSGSCAAATACIRI